jgi:NAD(P)H-dependent flavin oxidoreductase YrpB (nitropropane dioxygenase family)
MSQGPKAVGRRQMLKLMGLGSAALSLSAATQPHTYADGRFGGAAETNKHPRKLTLETRLTREFGVRYPFVAAGMAFVSMPTLVAAVSNAGGIGVLGVAPEPPAGLQMLIRQVKALTAYPFGVDFIHDTTAFGPAVIDEHIDICFAETIPLVVFHIDIPPSAWVERLQAGGAKVWMQAASVEQALEACSVGVDAIIAQGRQAGGHNKSKTRTLKLLRQVIDAIRGRMVLAAGGIADGAGVVRALANGADGVWVGTRLVASAEAYAAEEYKRRLTQAHGHATAITTAIGPEYPNVP